MRPVALGGGDGGTKSINAASVTAGWVDLGGYNMNTGGSTVSFGWAYRVVAASGTTVGPPTWTSSVSDGWSGLMVGLRAAAAAPAGSLPTILDATLTATVADAMTVYDGTAETALDSLAVWDGTTETQIWP